MKQLLFLIAFNLITLSVQGQQIAIIEDPDGFTNVREKAEGQSKVIHKILENEVFFYYIEGNEEWVHVYIPKNKFSLGDWPDWDIAGYTHRSRIKPLNELPTYSGSGFEFSYELGPFDSTSRIISWGKGKWISSIDGRRPWGTDGNLPKLVVKEVTVKIDEISIPIHQVFYSDLFECTNSFDIYRKGDVFFVYQTNSDGAGGYELAWVISKDGLMQRLVGTVY